MMISQQNISIEDIIREVIQKNGPISFRDFMEMALYAPGIGYYTSRDTTVGTKGDFMTGPSINSIFGTMVGIQLEEMWINTGGKQFTIVEYGAGNGQLCLDILNLISSDSRLIDNLNYCIIEKNGFDGYELKRNFPGVISVHRSIHELPEFTGCILSNEVVDSFPFHRVVMRDELMEIFIDFKEGFTELLIPARKELKNYLDTWNIRLPKGYYTEINLDARQWITDVSSKLKSGYMVTIDYGYSAGELYNEQRKTGTMMCYKKHVMNVIPYQFIGKQDITSHVNFSAVCQWGIDSGLQCCGLVTQAGFLLSLGIKNYFINQYSSHKDIATIALLESWLNDVLLIKMGSKFKVLIQKKGDVSPILSGLKT